MIDIAILDAAVPVAAFAGGALIGRIRRGPRPERCQCGHAPSFHYRTGCNATSRRVKYNNHGEHLGYHDFVCPCVRYVGPGSAYVPELDGPERAEIEP